jgi:hypothetical protein
MREIRPSGSVGGGAGKPALPTPIRPLKRSRLHCARCRADLLPELERPMLGASPRRVAAEAPTYRGSIGAAELHRPEPSCGTRAITVTGATFPAASKASQSTV